MVDSSPAAVARALLADDLCDVSEGLREHVIASVAALLARVAQERDAARAAMSSRNARLEIQQLRQEIDAAARQLAEARAALDDLSRAVLRDLRAEGEGQAADARKRLYDATNAARALLSGETPI